MASALWLGEMLHGIGQAFGYLIAASLLTTLVGLYLVRFDPHRDTPVDRESERAFSLSKYWAFWTSAFLLQVSFGFFYNFFTIYEAAHGFSQTTISYLWSFGVICEVAMLYFQVLSGAAAAQQPAGGHHVRHLHRRPALGDALALARQFAGLLCLPGASCVQLRPLLQRHHRLCLSALHPKKARPAVLSGITFGLGGSVGAALGGWVYDWRPEWLFAFATLLALGALGMMYIHAWRRRGYALG